MTGGWYTADSTRERRGEAAAEAAVWAPVEESETVTVTVVEEPEKAAAVEALDGAGTPA
jgi:hypothetical protein